MKLGLAHKTYNKLLVALMAVVPTAILYFIGNIYQTKKMTQTTGKHYYIGIDPGGSGGIAILNTFGMVHAVTPMPDTPTDILNLLSQYGDTENERIICVIERVHGMPGMGGASMFTFGENYGYCQMALLANKIPFEDHTPQKWMKYYQLKRAKEQSKTEWKNVLKAQAQQLFPNVKVTLSTADALLIAHYCFSINR
jgi:hypothetical protein